MPKSVKDLEEKYMKLICNIISSKDIFNQLSELENEIIQNKTKWEETYTKKNVIDISIERLLRFNFYKKLNSKIRKIYSSPISSDLAFVMKDCILNIDSKTVNVHSNSTDVSPAVIEKNQASFINKEILKNNDFSGYDFYGNLNSFVKIKNKNLPVLSYIIKVVYHDKGKKPCTNKCIKEDYYIEKKIRIYCIPNKSVVDDEFTENLIYGIKTYEYVNKTESNKFSHVDISPRDKIESHWIELNLDTGTNTKIRHKDNKIVNPFNKDIHSLWGYIANKYQFIKGGKTFRIKKNSLKKRLNSKEKYWSGYKEITPENTLNFLEKFCNKIKNGNK